MSGVALLSVFVLAGVVGFEVVSKVPTTLHPPLTSGTTAIHGIVLVGAVIVTGRARTGPELAVGLFATVLATVNLVGGFLATDRMLDRLTGHKLSGPRPPGGAE
jgi:NAD(P) transhydrogenase subunit alpha